MAAASPPLTPYPSTALPLFSRLSANARASTRPHPEQRDAADARARTCATCGAPRPERTDLRTCDYCGTAFMTAPAEEVRAHDDPERPDRER